jgi:hypothetical protein
LYLPQKVALVRDINLVSECSRNEYVAPYGKNDALDESQGQSINGPSSQYFAVIFRWLGKALFGSDGW